MRIKVLAAVVVSTCVLAGGAFIYTAYSAPVPAEKPKEDTIDWEGLWKDAKDPGLIVTLVVRNVHAPVGGNGTTGVFLVDGEDEHNVAWIAFYPIDKPASFIMGLEKVLLAMPKAPSKNAKIVVKDDKGRLSKLEKLEFEVRKPNSYPDKPLKKFEK